MFASDNFAMVNGGWDHVGYLAASGLPDIGTGSYSKGTLVDQDPNNENLAVLASGRILGVTTQDIDENGLNNDAGFKNYSIGKMDNPIRRSTSYVTVRRPNPGSHMEFEGLGEAAAGNLVCTTGVGAIADSDARGTELSTLNGCLRQAQSGEIVVAHLLDATLTPVTAGNLRILVERVPNSYTAS